MADIFTAPLSTSQQMADSLPEGKAWGSKNIDGSNTRKLINSLAVAHNRAQQQIELLAGEFNINNTVELLSDWETSVGEPDSCFDGVLGTLAQRRETVIEKLRKTPIVNLAEMQAYIDRKVPDIEVRLIPASTLQPAYASTENNDLTVTVGTDAFYPNTVGNNLTRTTNPTPHYIAATVGNDATVVEIVPGVQYTIEDAGATFVFGDLGKTIKFINADGTTAGTGLVSGEVAGVLTLSFTITGTIPTGIITGGLWGFSTEPVVDDGDYFMTAAGAYFSGVGTDVGKLIKTIDANGDELNTFEIMSDEDGALKVVGVNLSTGALVETVWTGGTWDFSTEAITPAADFNLVSQSSYFEVGHITDVIRIIDTAGAEVATMTISGFTSDTQVAATLTSGTISEGIIAGGLWGFDTETPINEFLSNPKFIIIAEVVGIGETFEYDFEIPFSNGIDASRVLCVMNKVMPSNVILLIQFVTE
jgi:hypothetical protein